MIARVFLSAALLSSCLFAQQREPLPLNHAFVVADRDTFEAALKDPFLRNELGAFEQRTTKRTDTTYTGLYWYGDHTYFEIMQPSQENPAGASGIAFGTDAVGTIARLEGRPLLKANAPKIQTITRGTADRQIDWFFRLPTPVQLKASRLDTFVLEYVPSFLDNWYPQNPPTNHAPTREHVLERYAGKIGETKQRQTGLFADVIAIELRLAEDDFPQFNTVCEYAGMTVDMKGSTLTCHGPDLTITAVAIPTIPAPAIAKITFRLHHAKQGKQEYRIGTSYLVFNGTTAEWSF